MKTYPPHTKNNTSKHIIARSRSRGVGFMYGNCRPQRQMSFHFRKGQEYLKAMWTHAPVAVLLTIISNNICKSPLKLFKNNFFLFFYFFSLNKRVFLFLYSYFCFHDLIEYKIIILKKLESSDFKINLSNFMETDIYELHILFFFKPF